jgi:prevent-host-death family protein
VSFSQARSGLTSLLDEVEARHEHVVITRNGLPRAVIMSPDEYEALQETIEVLEDPELLGALRRSEEDLKAGRVFDWETVKRDLGLA